MPRMLTVVWWVNFSLWNRNRNIFFLSLSPFLCFLVGALPKGTCTTGRSNFPLVPFYASSDIKTHSSQGCSYSRTLRRDACVCSPRVLIEHGRSRVLERVSSCKTLIMCSLGGLRWRGGEEGRGIRGLGIRKASATSATESEPGLS